MEETAIKENGATILASNPKLPEVFMTSDGQGFTTAEKAQTFQDSLDASKKVITVKREVAPAKETAQETILDLSVPKLTEALQEVSDEKILTGLLEAENAKGETARKGAVSAIQDRLDVITKQD